MMDVTLMVGVIVGVVQVVKQTGYVSKRFAGLFAIVLGLGLSNLFGDGEVTVRLFEGLMAGLMASGAWSSTKAVLK